MYFEAKGKFNDNFHGDSGVAEVYMYLTAYNSYIYVIHAHIQTHYASNATITCPQTNFHL